jgi:predicted metal-dependent phosphotriesterase family hydrolase
LVEKKKSPRSIGSRAASVQECAVAPDDLGITLPHEYLLIDFACRYSPVPDEAVLNGQPALDDRWRLPWSSAPSEFRIQSHTSKLLKSSVVSDFQFLNADANKIPVTSNPPH